MPLEEGLPAAASPEHHKHLDPFTAGWTRWAGGEYAPGEPGTPLAPPLRPRTSPHHRRRASVHLQGGGCHHQSAVTPSGQRRPASSTSRPRWSLWPPGGPSTLRDCDDAAAPSGHPIQLSTSPDGAGRLFRVVAELRSATPVPGSPSDPDLRWCDVLMSVAEITPPWRARTPTAGCRRGAVGAKAAPDPKRARPPPGAGSGKLTVRAIRQRDAMFIGPGGRVARRAAPSGSRRWRHGPLVMNTQGQSRKRSTAGSCPRRSAPSGASEERNGARRSGATAQQDGA